MSKKEFDIFINAQIDKQNNESPVDWEARRQEWLEHISQFYTMIEFFLKEYKESGKLSYQYSQKNITEEYAGSYSVRVLDIKLGEHKVRLEPIGTIIISATGRIDLIGANGKVKFVLVNKTYTAPSPAKVTIVSEGKQKSKDKKIEKPEKVELAWKIATPPPRIKYIDLDQNIFFDALLEVIGG